MGSLINSSHHDLLIRNKEELLCRKQLSTDFVNYINRRNSKTVVNACSSVRQRDKVILQHLRMFNQIETRKKGVKMSDVINADLKLQQNLKTHILERYKDNFKYQLLDKVRIFRKHKNFQDKLPANKQCATTRLTFCLRGYCSQERCGRKHRKYISSDVSNFGGDYQRSKKTGNFFMGVLRAERSITIRI